MEDVFAVQETGGFRFPTSRFLVSIVFCREDLVSNTVSERLGFSMNRKFQEHGFETV